MKQEVDMTELALAAIIGLLVGAGATSAVFMNRPQEPSGVHQGTEQAIQQLTQLDLTKPVCEPSYIATHTDLLCRELTCLQFSRGLDAKTAGSQCESISNVRNKIAIMDYCAEKTEPESAKECLEIFWRRN